MSISFTAPSGTGTITNYKVISSPSGITGTSSTSPIVVSGLTPNTSYTFTVTATNNGGTSAASGASTAKVTLPNITSFTISSETTTSISLLWSGGYTSVTITRNGTAVSTNNTGTTFTNTGLTVNTPYTYVITPKNSGGVLGSSTTIIQSTLSGPPTIGTATVIDSSSISIAFTPPGGTGTIISYTATSTPGGFTGTSSTSPIVVSGLTPNTSYTFSVTATNNGGTSTASTASTAKVTLPNITLFNISGETTTTISLLFAGGYTSATITRNGTAVSTNNVGTTFTDTGLTSNTPYTYIITPKNSAGVTGTTSTIIQSTISSPPTIGIATVSSTTAMSISFTAPSGTGTITNYKVISSPSGITGTGTSSPISVTGLSSNTIYTFTVTATNNGGTSTSSTASTAKTTVPDSPTIGTPSESTPTASSITFTPPSGNGTITNYKITSNPSGITGTGTSSPIIVSGLITNISYTFTMTATNTDGTSVSSSDTTSIILLPIVTFTGGATKTTNTYNGGINYTSYIFTSSGTLSIVGLLYTPTLIMNVLAVGGGGSGGLNNTGNKDFVGGGGGGGFISKPYTLTTGPDETITISVGAGGEIQTTAGNGGNVGSNTSLIYSSRTTLQRTALGGGGGDGTIGVGSSGGSGGGGGISGFGYSASSQTDNSGNAGGNSSSSGQKYGGGGGGGAGEVGGIATSGISGNGGSGLNSVLGGINPAWYFGGGGGGGGSSNTITAGIGGIGGGGGATADIKGVPSTAFGGNNSYNTSTIDNASGTTAGSGIPNSGGGGGGAGNAASAVGSSGGSGIVIITILSSTIL